MRIFDQDKKKDELLKMFAAYNPTVHTGEEDGWDWLFDDNEFAIEIINPKGKIQTDNICIAFEDSVDYEFTFYFSGWHHYYKMNESEYSIFLEQIKEILDNKICILAAYQPSKSRRKIEDDNVLYILSAKQFTRDSDKNEIFNVFKDFKSEYPKICKIEVSYWDSDLSFIVEKKIKCNT